mmetsp:Transcript_15700/g.42607  ORF Transcript_15700/g.42607 Transcript_15700/m.42607 type:complete len:447 (+) Transcript_15700:79-1419(+)|eukprot:CAMPEP_0202356992 /NCGR_PEP_ID=MMETSP1126-20121109/11210_1 /ASSEMBLY_ACC=CAM_ASM_000457 /TAXON_ID=3047 /ORGANISM="Dunaliella tertiolecta, Strain CCMP1320" /LENGTH=446 /DNA_ID=CAMNT_0048949809 /DNA_START=39 /DNA_END=1379 /DNA_ORIENTATION=-
MTKSKHSRLQEEQLAPATEKVLRQITALYEQGLVGDSTGGSMGLQDIAQSPQLQMTMRKPRKKVSCMVVGNHSAGKSSFINWYIGEGIQKTGVAIETRGFTFVTSGKKRETLTGEATIRFYDFLKDFQQFEGIIPNLFTEISPSKEKNFACVDWIDTPGLVDGEMSYPFDVLKAILWMAEHVDMILIFFDPIGQATCKRTMEVVSALNNYPPAVEKLHYFMSKADAVEKEHDRQRVLIQITQNLATRIRNSHAFNLPTFYIPPEDGSPCPIPNAIEEVCQSVDKSINMTVQRNLRVLKEDCENILARCTKVLADDKQKKAENLSRRMYGILYYLLASMSTCLLVSLVVTRILPSICNVTEVCTHGAVRGLVRISPAVAEHFMLLLTITLALVGFFTLMGKITWRIKPVFNKRDLKKIDEYRVMTQKIMETEQGLYDEYFKTLGAER